MDFFYDPDIEIAQRNRGCLRLGCWTIRLPRLLGFCGGVVNAVRTVQRTITENPGRRIWLMGEIIHNHTVNDYFRNRGVIVLDNDELRDSLGRMANDDIVVIPAFGLEFELDAQLRRMACDIKIVDTTCPKVKHIWALLEQDAAKGKTVVIHGKPSHPETRATLSRALLSGRAVIMVPDISHAELLAASISHGAIGRQYPAGLIAHPKRIFPSNLVLVNQTTMLYEETREIEVILRNAVEKCNGTLLSSETVCSATQHRQDAAREVCASRCDMILVVGGFSSSNTTQLYRVACQAAPTFFIGDAGAMGLDVIRHYRPAADVVVETRDWLPPPGSTIGLLAGASCPASDVGNVIRRLRDLV